MSQMTALAPPTDQAPPTRRRHLRIVPVMIAGALLLASCMSSDQSAAFDKVNASRTTRSVSALADDNTAQEKAQAWAEHLASSNTLQHSNLAHGMDGQWKRLAENVGYGSSIGAVHQQFMTSSGHRANILDSRFTHVGVGVAKGHGRVFVVQVFVQR